MENCYIDPYLPNHIVPYSGSHLTLLLLSRRGHCPPLGTYWLLTVTAHYWPSDVGAHVYIIFQWPHVSGCQPTWLTSSCQPTWAAYIHASRSCLHSWNMTAMSKVNMQHTSLSYFAKCPPLDIFLASLSISVSPPTSDKKCTSERDLSIMQHLLVLAII